ncbi:tyrosine-type recombinase/integrase [Nesterenkonia haasae]|uniref:tyrosine-type recombinase/integrase n=1 Tax=Nesterenkonia haasae TaxID=2587813 RepID=UPI001391204B|nr:tyrosine-type recombinase/integrase [Nesterenkonia haasae]NDK31161.1 hypothetical protein [Nesterenkonia haasae]
MARGKGEGSISYDAKKGLHRVRVELPPIWDEAEGKWKRRHRYASSKDKKKAMQKLVKIQREVERGNLSSKTITVDKWVEHWLKDIAPQKINPNSIKSYRSALNKHVAERYKGKKLQELTPQRIRSLTAEIAERKSPGTARNLHSYLSKCLSDAVGDGYLLEHPMQHLTIPKRGKTVEKALTVEQAVELLKWLGKQMDEKTKHAHLAPLWIAFLLTGARKGELLGLEPDRVGSHLDVTWQLQRLNAEDVAAASKDYEYRHAGVKNFYLVRPKSKSGWRSYPLVEPLASIIKSLAADTPKGALVFRTPEGEPWDGDKITDLWYEMLVDSEIEMSATPTKERVNVHGARHTVADLLDLLGIPESVIMDILGHSTRHMSRSYRTRQSPAVKDAMESVSRLLQTGHAPQSAQLSSQLQ